MHLLDPLSQLLLQLATILVAARIVGGLFARAGQPAVIGEMAAGILLGPSLLGWMAPSVFHSLFPSAWRITGDRFFFGDTAWAEAHESSRQTASPADT